MAKALGIPAVVGIGDELLEIEVEAILLVDGTSGLVVSGPNPDIVTDFERRIQAEREKCIIYLFIGKNEYFSLQNGSSPVHRLRPRFQYSPFN